MRRNILTVATAIVLVLLGNRADAKQLTIFAAASLSVVVDEIIESQRDVNLLEGVRTSYAASSTLAQQLSNGAPANIFISANRAWITHLEKRGVVEPRNTAVIASNRLSVIVPQAATIARISALNELQMLLRGGRLAVGNPAHVPAGLYARAALLATGQWATLRRRLIPTAHVRAALRFVETGEAPAGIVYASDAWRNTRVKTALQIPSDLHPKIEYIAALLGTEVTPSAKLVYEFLQTERAAEIYQRHGFSID